MAIARGAGTEIIRSAGFEVVDSTTSKLIIGVQHHIYTVLSVIVYSVSVNSAGNYIQMQLNRYDSKAGDTAQPIIIFRNDMQAFQTYVWDDKFSFNGFEPTDFTGPMDDATKQDAIADQGSSVSNDLRIASEHADDGFCVNVTYIDQNNA
jgi:hypothetical protein